MNKPIFDHFGFLAPFYEHFIQPKTPQKLCDLVDCPPFGLILDAGGGTGRVSQFLSDHANQVVVADQSARMLKQTLVKESLRPVCTITEALPFQDDIFDRIIMVDAMHHVEQQEQSAMELWRVLKRGGRIVIEEPDISHCAVKIVAFFEKLVLMRSHFLTPEKIAAFYHPLQIKPNIERESHNAWIVIDKPE